MGGMEKDDRKPLGTLRKEGGHEQAEERMEDWFNESVATSEFEEGEVVRGRVVHVGSSEVLVDVGYKSEGAIPIEEFHRHGGRSEERRVGKECSTRGAPDQQNEEHVDYRQGYFILGMKNS